MTDHAPERQVVAENELVRVQTGRHLAHEALEAYGVPGSAATVKREVLSEGVSYDEHVLASVYAVHGGNADKPAGDSLDQHL